MSSILKALRRAEGHRSSPRLFWPLAWRRDSSASGWPRQAVIVLGVLILAAGVGGGFIGYWGFGLNQPPTDTVNATDGTPPGASPKALSESPAGTLEPTPLLPKPVVGPPDPAFLKSVADTVAEVKSSKPRTSNSKPSQPSPTPRLPPVNRNTPVGAPEVDLQAVIWAPAPEHRMAMVNGRLLHIGDQVSDVLIEAITEDDVVFQWRGSKWRRSHTGGATVE